MRGELTDGEDLDYVLGILKPRDPSLARRRIRQIIKGLREAAADLLDDGTNRRALASLRDDLRRAEMAFKSLPATARRSLEVIASRTAFADRRGHGLDADFDPRVLPAVLGFHARLCDRALELQSRPRNRPVNLFDFYLVWMCYKLFEGYRHRKPAAGSREFRDLVYHVSALVTGRGKTLECARERVVQSCEHDDPVDLDSLASPESAKLH